QTSILMSESFVGVSVAVMRQNAGRAAYGDDPPARPVAAGGANAPGETREAQVTLPAASVSVLSDSHDAPVTISVVGAGSLDSSSELTARSATRVKQPVAMRMFHRLRKEWSCRRVNLPHARGVLS